MPARDPALQRARQRALASIRARAVKRCTLAGAPPGSLGHALRAARLAAGMTRPEVARAMGCSVWTVQNLECSGGAQPRFYTVLRFARAVGLDTGALG